MVFSTLLLPIVLAVGGVNALLDSKQRAIDLLAQMTIEEKVAMSVFVYK